MSSTEQQIKPNVFQQRVAVLLAEYNTLRAEVLWARDNVWKVLQLGVPGIAALMGLIVSTEWKISLIILTSILAFIVIGTAFWNDRNTRSFTARLRDIEKEVNDLIGGSELLVWETHHGWGSIFWPPSNPIFRMKRRFFP
jgi:hypothetical protein